MKFRLVLFSMACVLLIAETSPAAVITTYTGSGVSYNPGTVYVQPQPVAQPVLVPAANVQVLQVPVQNSGQQIAVIPVNTPSSNSFGDKLYNVFYGISNSIVSKTRTLGDLIRTLCGRPQYVRPQYVLVNVPTTESTTTTKKCKTTSTSTSTSTTSTTTESTTSTTAESYERCDNCDDEDDEDTDDN